MEKKTVVVIKTENSFDITEHAYSIPKFEFDSDIKSLQMQEEMANLAASTITNTTDIKIEPIEDEIEEDQPELIQLADVVKEESYLIDEEVSIKDESDKQNPEDSETLTAVSKNSETRKQSTEMNKRKYKKDSSKYLRCNKCSYKTFKRELYENHMNYERKKKDEIFQCDECEFKTTMGTLLDENLWKQHGIAKVSEPLKSIEIFECNICPYKTVSSGKLHLHLWQTHNTIQIFKCTICSFETSNGIDYEKHKEIFHNISAAIRKNMSPRSVAIVCDMCDSFTTFYHGVLVQHKKLHTLSNGKLQCHLCRQVVSNKIALRQHISYHKSERRHVKQIDVQKNDIEEITYDIHGNEIMTEHVEGDSYLADSQ